MSDFKIIGNPDPTVGKEEFYSVNSFLPTVLPFQNPASTTSFEQPVKWEIYILENGRWRKTKENDKTGKKISYTFLQKSLDRKGIRILARRGEDVGRLNVKTHPAEEPKIEKIELLDKDGKKPSKPLSYGQTLKARVHCLHMEKRKVYVTLWEDDVNGAGHNKANEKNIIKTLSVIVKNGKADVDFLLIPSFAKIAKKDGAEDKIHEYYVTTDFNKEKLASNNVDVNDLETPVAPYKKKVPVQQSIPQNTPAKKPVQTKPNTPTSSGSAAKEKAEITRVHLTDTNGRTISGVFKEKQIKVWIDSKGLIGKEIRLKLFDEDGISDDLLFDQKFTIKSNIYSVVVSLNEILRSKGGDNIFEGSQQEVYAYVEVIGTNKNKPSEIVQVDVKVFKPDPVEVTNKVSTVNDADKKDDKKDEKKGECDNCNAEIDLIQLQHIFTNADTTVLESALKIYNKYMGELGMNTCWNKAHFFAQAVVESGLKMEAKNGESFNWYYPDLINTFGKFQTEEGRIKAEKWGRKIKNRKDPRAVDVTLENQKNIANWAYMPDYKTGKQLGNKGGNDGWDFRGRGLLQLTGRGGYEYANTYTLKLGSDILKKPELAGEDISTAVLSSMAFFKWKGLNKIANGTTDVIGKICPQVGNNVEVKDKNGNKSSNYKEKQDAFTNVTSKEFLINACKWKKEGNTSGKWHEPVDNPVSTLYMQGGIGGKLGEHWGLFGNTRNGGIHQGLDLFIEPGGNVYSCVKGEVYESKVHTGYGKTVTIKVIDKEAFYNHRREYKALYSSAGEIIQGQHFDKSKDIYLFYAHLRNVKVKKGEKVDAGKVIAISGVSGVIDGTCAPHLHFEIFTTVYAVGMGLNYRCNPGFYVHFKGASEQSAQEKNLQKKVSEKGKIKEVNGKD